MLMSDLGYIGLMDKKLSAFAADACRFVICFLVPISESVPHIYLSALPFAPQKSKVSKHFLSRFPQQILVATGQGQSLASYS